MTKTKQIMEEEIQKLSYDGSVKGAIGILTDEQEQDLRQSIIRIIETAMGEIEDQLIAWACPVCKKVDFKNEDEQSAKPEHIAYRGVDIGSCRGQMIKLYSSSKDRIQSILNSVKE